MLKTRLSISLSNFLVLIYYLFLTSCTFRPLLNNDPMSQKNNCKIDFKVSPNKTKDSYIMTKALTQLFDSITIKNNKSYTLKINLSKTSRNVSIYSDGTVGRDETNYQCTYELIEHGAKKPILSDTIISSESHNALFASTNIIESTYGASNDNQIENIAQKIFNHVILSLNENRPSNS